MLLVLALPVFSIRLLFADAGNDPPNLTTRQAYDLLADGFGPGTNGPLVVAVDLAGGGPGVADQLATAIRSTPGVAAVVPPQVNDSGDTAVIVAIPRSSPQDEATKALVERLRGHVIPPVVGSSGAQALVGGVTAAGVDAAQYFSQRLIWVIGAVVLLSFFLLMLVFHSILVPLTAAIMNLLSVAAAYGATVAVFQWGWAKGLIGLESTVPIVPFVPMMMFAVLFGLSMDYQVFLLTRVREEYEKTGDTREGVVRGLARTARVITSAALIMIFVFGAFVLNFSPEVKMFGLGLSVAVLVDSTIVRMMLVPSIMEILGDANWWFPKWLDRVLPRVDVEGHSGVEAHHEPLPGALPATTGASGPPRSSGMAGS